MGIGFSQLWRKVFADRGTHLAAMVAYFALLSFVPLVFLALALFGLTGRVDASTFFVHELKRAFPGTSLGSIVGARRQGAAQRRRARDHRRRRPALVVALALQRARVGPQRRLRTAEPPLRPRERDRRGADGERARHALRQPRGRAVGFDALGHNFGFAEDPVIASLLFAGSSLVGVFLFLLAVPLAAEYGGELARGAAGAVLGALALAATFQVLPLFVRFADVNVTLRTLGGPAILLIWLYVMANGIVFGGELNWWSRERVRARGEAPAPPVPGGS